MWERPPALSTTASLRQLGSNGLRGKLAVATPADVFYKLLKDVETALAEGKIRDS
ncbi:MAG: hypothetical protein OWQ51_07915 [Pyrobaculum arsenaticum]|uniref:Uncharacterized protein n=1 Tax=Pyrobaculum arsenaticum TaxID=121277 RepID=A0A7L4P8V3_9CREN|nr:hypothetical protein [Pyrobaculum arsenaticum]MCY0890888.1 hypothetical protein [Pyrobaculum arsenaticum]NYR15093.1 hypothetical protein [Pyrobaculum arsenaticum]